MSFYDKMWTQWHHGLKLLADRFKRAGLTPPPLIAKSAVIGSFVALTPQRTLCVIVRTSSTRVSPIIPKDVPLGKDFTLESIHEAATSVEVVSAHVEISKSCSRRVSKSRLSCGNQNGVPQKQKLV
jgi:hypothetical protein